ncbi:signal peptidase I [Dokdonia sp.]|uniref:signal peptidase I n=1 Tax=Dokdonia sp. TaxID=2024995 RepID=UPI00326753E1
MFISKKKKILLGITLLFFSLFIGYHFMGSKGYFKIYKIPTTASSPTLELGDYVIVSNLVAVKNNDFISFWHQEEIFGTGHWMFRMVAKEQDTLSIIDGITYVNGINIDKNIRLKHSYTINQDQLKSISHTLVPGQEEYYTIGENMIIIHLEDSVVKNHIPKALLSYTQTPKEKHSKVNKDFPNDWDNYNFGPLIIPKNKFFVMGDNRDNAMDSRYIGLIDKSNYVGKAINVN